MAGVVGSLVLGALFIYVSDLAARGTPLSPSPIVAAPATPVLSVRRAPTVLSVLTRTGRVLRAMQPVVNQVGANGCLSVTWKGSTLGAANVDAPLIPASTLKLITGSVALEVLGSSFVFETAVHGNPDGLGTVPTLYLVGGGDPVLVTADYPPTERYPTTAGTALEKLADAVVSSGVRTVAAGVVAIDDRYDAERYVPQWAPSLRGIEGGPLGALMVNDGTVMGEQFKPDDPAVAASREFIRLLRARGVTVNGGASRGTLPSGSTSIAAVQSAPLQTIVADMLSRSDNNTAEILLKEMGLAKKGAGTTLNGSLVMLETLRARGPQNGLQVVDGSGLARENRASCAMLMAVLAREAESFPAMLSVAGTSGTLRDWFEDHPAKGRLVAKTGTLSDVKSLAGYVLVEGDDPVMFSLLLNRPGIDEPAAHRVIWNSLADGLARAQGTPRPDQLLP